jgi:hypothetical protein
LDFNTGFQLPLDYQWVYHLLNYHLKLKSESIQDNLKNWIDLKLVMDINEEEDEYSW